MLTPHLRALLAVYLLLLLTVFTAGCAAHTEAQTPPPPKVTVEPLEARQLSDYEEYNGWVDSSHIQEVRSRVRGHVHKAPFTDGQLVKTGDVLFQLDPRPFQSDLDRSKEQVKIFEAQQVAAAKEAARQRELLSKGGASQSVVDKAEADAKSLDASIASAREEVKRKELDLSYATVRAEIDGKVSKALLQEGNLVNAGGSDPLLTTIVAVDPMRVYFNIDERTLTRFAKNMGKEGKNLSDLLAKLKEEKLPFTFALDGETEFAHQGVLAFGDNRIDPTTGTLQLYGTVENKDGKYLPGSRVRVRLPVGKPYTALLVPESAILADQDKRYVLIAVGDKHEVKRRNITLGRLTDDSKRAITPEGKPDAADPPEKWNVLVDNLQRARLNYPIEPQKPAAAPVAVTTEKTSGKEPAPEKKPGSVAPEKPAPEKPGGKEKPAAETKPAAEKKLDLVPVPAERAAPLIPPPPAPVAAPTETAPKK